MEHMRMVDLRSEKPVITATLRTLAFEIASARATDGHLIKVVHGGGGTACGARIKEPVRAFLRRYKRENKIRFFVPGESFSDSDTASRYLTEKFPAAREEDDAYGTLSDSYVIICL